MLAICSLVLLFLPIAFLGFWHSYEWGGTFGSKPRLWGAGSFVAAISLVVITAYEIHLIFSGLKYPWRLVRASAWLGLGVGLAMFPSAASTFASYYRGMAIAHATRMFAVVGWMFITIGLFRLMRVL